MTCGERDTGEFMYPFGSRPPGAQPTVQVPLTDEPSGREHFAKVGAVVRGGARGPQRLEGEGFIAEQETHLPSPINYRRYGGVTPLVHGNPQSDRTQP